MRQLALLVFDGHRKRASAEVDYRRLSALVRASSRMIGSEALLWKQYGPETLKPRPIVGYSLIDAALQLAVVKAPTQEDRREWWNLLFGNMVNLLRHPYSREVYYSKSPPENDAADHALVSRIQLDLPFTRERMAKSVGLEPEHWGLYSGLHWADSSGTIVLKDGDVYASVTALQRVGVRVRIGPTTAVVRNGNHIAEIPLWKPNKGTAGNGKPRLDNVYVPIRELDRKGVHEVRVYRLAQVVEVFPDPPEKSRHVPQ